MSYRRSDANVVFKLDMAKAYDRVSWEFLHQVLRRKVFPQRWIGLVGNAISHCWFSVLVNDEHAGFFHSTPALCGAPDDVLSGLGNNESLPWREAGLDSKCVAGHSIASASGDSPAQRFRGKSSLWSEYLHSRYCRNLHPTIVPYNRNHSSVWHRLYRIRDVAEPFIFWTLGEGFVSFWCDNLFGEKPLAQLLHKDTYTMEPVSYYWNEGDWNIPRILRIIHMPFAQTIYQIPIAAGQGDKIVWTGSNTGDFSTKLAWEAIRHASPRRKLLADVWHHSLRPTISVFLWRLFQDRIPVDARIVAVQGVWQHFTAIFGLCLYDTGNLTHMRNAAKYRGVPFSTDGIILVVQRHLRILYAARTLTSTQWKGDLHQAAVMGFIFRQQGPRAPSIVRWRAPSPSWFKLYTDGSSFRNPGLAGAAGIIRDSAGHVHLAYQFALGTGTSVLAELTAVWRRMELALTHGLAPLVVEVDAMALLVADVQQVFREANGAADHHAKEAASLQLTRVLHHGDITGVLRAVLCLDRQGVPYLRRG
ncbi:hypothetical protein Sango_2747700 [Sesamum angolense]|uniref:Uncharacterized protein n=1 Tax=Sesamum angolense TaxID=2727404 RepID=A0AAE1VXV6_9LAMI|nr:hypothetical protein Sango_2747700 [Sesamum angolense]